MLKVLVEKYGTHSWPEVANDLPGRTSKSCSLRWDTPPANGGQVTAVFI